MQEFDYLIIGSGPIGSAIGYFLSQKTDNFAIITADPIDNDSKQLSTYYQAGGSVRWRFDDPTKNLSTKQTANFILDLDRQNVDLSLIKDHYLFLKNGTSFDSINISGKKLINYLLSQLSPDQIFYQHLYQSYQKTDNGFSVLTDKAEFNTNNIIFCLGYNNQKFIPDLPLEKRVLLVLNKVVNSENINFPHLVVPFKTGVVYIFLKKFGDEYKFVLGQEGVLEHELNQIAEDFLPQLKSLGLGDILPLLNSVDTEKILSGTDVNFKDFQTQNIELGVIAINCGSAIRQCIYIGKTVVENLRLKT